MERNYELYDRELLGIIHALEEWQHYIQGSGHTTVVHSDHQNLMFFKSAQKLNRQQAQWALYLSEFDIKLVHMPGSKMIQSDALSRQPDFIPDEDHDNENRILLPEDMFINLIDTNLQDRIVLSCRTLIQKGLFGLILITRLLASAYVLCLLTTHSASI